MVHFRLQHRRIFHDVIILSNLGRSHVRIICAAFSPSDAFTDVEAYRFLDFVRPNYEVGWLFFFQLWLETELECLVLGLTILEVDAGEFDVEVTEPLINVAFVLGFDVLELVDAIVDGTVHEWQFELALVDLEVDIHEGKRTPADNVVVLAALRQPDHLKTENGGEAHFVLGRTQEVDFVVEPELFLQWAGLELDDAGMRHGEVDEVHCLALTLVEDDVSAEMHAHLRRRLALRPVLLQQPFVIFVGQI